MYIELLLVQLKQEEIEQMARDAWKNQINKNEITDESVFKRWFSRKQPLTAACCAKVC